MHSKPQDTQDNGKVNAPQGQKTEVVKRGRGRPPLHKKDANGKAIIELDENGNRVVPVQKYKPRGRRGDHQSEEFAPKPALREKPASKSAPKSTPNTTAMSTSKPVPQSRAFLIAGVTCKAHSASTSPNGTPSFGDTLSEAGPGPANTRKRKASDALEAIWGNIYEEDQKETRQRRRGMTWARGEQEGREIENMRAGPVYEEEWDGDLNYDTDFDLLDEKWWSEAEESAPPQSSDSELDFSDVAGATPDNPIILDTQDLNDVEAQGQDDLYDIPTVFDKQEHIKPHQSFHSVDKGTSTEDLSGEYPLVEDNSIPQNLPTLVWKNDDMFNERNLVVLPVEPLVEEDGLVPGDGPGLFESAFMQNFMFEYGL